VSDATPQPATLDDLAALLTRVVAAVEAAPVEGLDARAAAAFCGVSESKWRDMDTRGHCPTPAQLGDGRCPRWSRSELLAWFRAGCPSRASWRLVRDQLLRRTA
jgi:predicted DNA-binding transcriptional regulator AlpA